MVAQTPSPGHCTNGVLRCHSPVSSTLSDAPQTGRRLTCSHDTEVPGDRAGVSWAQGSPCHGVGPEPAVSRTQDWSSPCRDHSRIDGRHLRRPHENSTKEESGVPGVRGPTEARTHPPGVTPGHPLVRPRGPKTWRSQFSKGDKIPCLPETKTSQNRICFTSKGGTTGPEPVQTLPVPAGTPYARTHTDVQDGTRYAVRPDPVSVSTTAATCLGSRTSGPAPRAARRNERSSTDTRPQDRESRSPGRRGGPSPHDSQVTNCPRPRPSCRTPPTPTPVPMSGKSTLSQPTPTFSGRTLHARGPGSDPYPLPTDVWDLLRRVAASLRCRPVARPDPSRP